MLLSHFQVKERSGVYIYKREKYAITGKSICSMELNNYKANHIITQIKEDKKNVQITLSS